jgi:hypothetical protein
MEGPASSEALTYAPFANMVNIDRRRLADCAGICTMQGVILGAIDLGRYLSDL